MIHDAPGQGPVVGAARRSLIVFVSAIGALLFAACGGGSEGTPETGDSESPAEQQLTGGRVDGSYAVTWQITSYRYKGDASVALFKPDSTGTENWTLRCGGTSCSIKSDDLSKGSLAALLSQSFELKGLEGGSEGVSQTKKVVDHCAGQNVAVTYGIDLRGSNPEMAGGDVVFSELAGRVTVDPSVLRVKRKQFGYTETCDYSRLQFAVSGTRVG